MVQKVLFPENYSKKYRPRQGKKDKSPTNECHGKEKKKGERDEAIEEQEEKLSSGQDKSAVNSWMNSELNEHSTK